MYARSAILNGFCNFQRFSCQPDSIDLYPLESLISFMFEDMIRWGRMCTVAKLYIGNLLKLLAQWIYFRKSSKPSQSRHAPLKNLFVDCTGKTGACSCRLNCVYSSIVPWRDHLNAQTIHASSLLPDYKQRLPSYFAMPIYGSKQKDQRQWNMHRGTMSQYT